MAGLFLTRGAGTGAAVTSRSCHLTTVLLRIMYSILGGWVTFTYLVMYSILGGGAWAWASWQSWSPWLLCVILSKVRCSCAVRKTTTATKNPSRSEVRRLRGTCCCICEDRDSEPPLGGGLAGCMGPIF